MFKNSLHTYIIIACAIGYAAISFFIPELNILIPITQFLFTLIGVTGMEVVGSKSTAEVITVLLLSFCTNLVFGWTMAVILYKLFKYSGKFRE